jgi:hypothetical protein
MRVEPISGSWWLYKRERDQKIYIDMHCLVSGLSPRLKQWPGQFWGLSFQNYEVNKPLFSKLSSLRYLSKENSLTTIYVGTRFHLAWPSTQDC